MSEPVSDKEIDRAFRCALKAAGGIGRLAGVIVLALYWPILLALLGWVFLD